jgi:hypothetical protein
MAHTLKELRAMSEEKLIEEHDAIASTTSFNNVGLTYYHDELKRREQDRQTATIIKYTRLMLFLTICIALLTIINVIAVALPLFCGLFLATPFKCILLHPRNLGCRARREFPRSGLFRLLCFFVLFSLPLALASVDERSCGYGHAVFPGVVCLIVPHDLQHVVQGGKPFGGSSIGDGF